MSDRDPAAYGELHAGVYDRIYGTRFDPAAAVAALAAAAAGGRVLELGVGTGRLAIPLAASGVAVDGIEASPAMIDRLQASAGGDRVGVVQGDLADFTLVRNDYQVAVCAVSTLFMLDHDAQHGCLKAVARHLRPGGSLFVEAFRLDPGRFDADGRRQEQRATAGGVHHSTTSRHDPATCRIHITHTLTTRGVGADYPVTLHYVSPEELDVMAGSVGLTPAGRWHDWAGTPARAESRDPISRYHR